MLTVFTTFVRISNPLKKPQNTAYINMSVCVIMSCIFDISASLLINASSQGIDVPLYLSYAANIMFFIMFVFDGFYYCVYLYTLIGGVNFRKTSTHHWICIPVTIYILFTVSTPWTHLLFYFDENGIYTFGKLHFVASLVMSFYAAAGIIFLCINRKKMKPVQFCSALVFIVISWAGLYIQKIFLPETCIGFAAASLSAVMIYFALQTPDSYVLMKTLDELKIAKENAEAASKSKEDFLTHMSHEIRTPINSMLGMNEMIIRKSNDEEITDYALTAQKSGRNLLDIVNNVLDYTKLNSGETEICNTEFSIEDVLRSVIIEAKEQLGGSDAEFETDIDSCIPCRLYGDEDRIKQIFHNIINNAVKYTEHGKIIFTALCEPDKNDNVKLSFIIADTGCGIRTEDQSRIFDSFVCLDNDKNSGVNGAGLGLAVTSKLLEKMGSRLNLKSEYGVGSTFSFELIMKVADKKPVGSLNAETEITNKNDDNMELYAPEAKVLVVDDSEVNLFIIQEILKQFGIHSDAANGGESCFNMACGTEYDLIFLDHMMPEPDGIKTMKMIKETTGCLSRNTPVIVLTANAVVGAREQYLKQGFDDYMSKPVSCKTVADMLKQYLPHEIVSFRLKDKQINDTADIFKDIKLSQINAEEGLKHCSGNSESYFNMLTLFAEQAADYAVRLEENLRSGDMTDYAIISHAVKSSSMSIGASTLSDIAKLQEMFAKSNNKGEVTTLHTDFINGLNEVTAEARKICYINVKEEEPSIPEVLHEITTEEYLSILKKIVGKLYYYDEEAALEAISLLDNASYGSDPCFLTAEKARSMIRNFDMDGALEYIKNIVEKINK